MSSRRSTATLLCSLVVASSAAMSAHGNTPGGLPPARAAEVVIMQGAEIPDWSRLSAVAHPSAWPSGYLDGVRSAHHGSLSVPPDVRTGVVPEQIAAYKWNGSGFSEVPVQVDQRFPHVLANANSSFAMYSAIDEELTYQWDVEAWKKVAGECSARYPTAAELAGLVSSGVIQPGQGETASDYLGAAVDPVPTLDDDDEISFMAKDAGSRAPAPSVPGASSTHEIKLVDPTDPARESFIYLSVTPSGSSFDAANGYVSYNRAADADEWIDRHSFLASDPEKLGSSNTGYGPNLPGTVCKTAGQPDGPRASTDRFPRDGVTVSTDKYRWHASGRWMVRSMQVADPSDPSTYGPDLIDRWKGRAFQQSADSSISVVGFEDEQVNWEGNSALLGERAGPVRAIREVWGADSGTNVTKTETFYRDAVVYRYHVRVHPIPPDGLYTSWDYNAGVAAKYYNQLRPEGVDIDGVNDDIGNVDDLAGMPAYFDANDPTFNLALANYNWEQVSGAGDTGSLVYTLEMKGATTALNPLVVPYYRDDSCLDDSTGDNPVARPWPGESSTDQRVKNGYSAQAGGTPYADLTCGQKQGAWGSHGVHYFVTHDTDNGFQSKPATEIDAQQWQFAVPTSAPSSIGEAYANVVRAPLKVVVL